MRPAQQDGRARDDHGSRTYGYGRTGEFRTGREESVHLDDDALADIVAGHDTLVMGRH
jgi:hypothetical protein